MTGYSGHNRRGWTADTEKEIARKIIELEDKARDAIEQYPTAAAILREKPKRGGGTRWWKVQQLIKAVAACERYARKLKGNGQALKKAVNTATMALHEAEQNRWKLATSIPRLVQQDSAKFAGRLREEHDDTRQDALLGAYEAAVRFDPDKGIAFTTYARWWIRASMTRSFEKGGRNVRLPGGAREQTRNLRNAIETSMKELGYWCIEEVAAAVGVSLERAHFLLSDPSTTISFETPDMNGNPLSDSLADDTDHEEHLSKIATETMLGKIGGLELTEKASRLNRRQRDVIIWYYGLDGQPPMTFAQIGRALKLSRERARQIHKDALGRLRKKVV